MTKYDDVDWHIEEAAQAGQPDANAGAHIVLYLRWLIARELNNSDFLDAGKPLDLTVDLDGKLMSDSMTPDGE